MNEHHDRPEQTDGAEATSRTAVHPGIHGPAPPAATAGGRRRQRRHADRFLVEAANLLASSLDYEETLAAVARLAVRSVADSCAIDIVEGGEIRRLEVAHADPARAALAAELLRLPIDRRRPHLTRTVLETGTSVLIGEVTQAILDEVSLTPERRRIIEALRPKSIMAVPMMARGRLVGVLLLADSTRRFDAGDLAFAEKLGRLAGLEVDNARQFREARQALQARDRVLGVVAHDLRNPLNTILMSAELLLDLPLSPKERDQRFEVIIRSARRMDRLIQDLLDVARLEAGRLRLQQEAWSPETLVQEAVDLSAARAAAKHLELRLGVSGSGRVQVSADRDRMLRVLTNLIDNAVKFTPEGGRVELRIEEVDTGVRFAVADTGVGIAPEDLPHLFEPFWQAAGNADGGTGLGLAIARGIVEAHGGSIEATSEPGRGSTFQFTLPGCRPMEEEPDTTPARGEEAVHHDGEPATDGEYQLRRSR